MDRILSQFKSLMYQLSQLPFFEQEVLCNKMQFTFDDFVKKFPSYAVKVYKDVFGNLLRETGFTAENKTILEIGPGFSIGVLFLAAVSGAAKVNAVDAFPHDKGTDNDYIVTMYRQLLNDRTFLQTSVAKMSESQFTEIFSKYIVKDEFGKFSYNSRKIKLDYPFKVEKLPYDSDVFDCAYSFATFEHFRDPHAAAKELYRITKPGGISYHSVDLRDHRDFEHSLDFLTVDKSTWQRYGDEITNYSYTNRLRSSEIIECFKMQGFKYRKHIPFLQISISDEFRNKLHHDYTRFTSEELGILGCIYIFQK